MENMKKTGIALFCLTMSFFAYAAPAFAEFNVDWGKSWDNSNKYGYDYLADWLVGNGYYTSENKADAVKFAINGYMGKEGSGTPSHFYWDSGKYTFTLEQEIAGWADINSYGYYTANKPNGITLTQAFEGTAAAGASYDGTINKDFGMYIKTPYDTWYTDKFFNTGDSDGRKPQVLVYELENNKKWLVAFEDIKYASGDRDYNDAYVLVNAVAPEPISAVLFLMGGAGLATRKLIKRKK
jgi:hypothetical protein